MGHFYKRLGHMVPFLCATNITSFLHQANTTIITSCLPSSSILFLLFEASWTLLQIIPVHLILSSCQQIFAYHSLFRLSLKQSKTTTFQVFLVRHCIYSPSCPFFFLKKSFPDLFSFSSKKYLLLQHAPCSF